MKFFQYFRREIYTKVHKQNHSNILYKSFLLFLRPTSTNKVTSLITTCLLAYAVDDTESPTVVDAALRFHADALLVVRLNSFRHKQFRAGVGNVGRTLLSLARKQRNVVRLFHLLLPCLLGLSRVSSEEK